MSSTSTFLSAWNGDLESGNFNGWNGWQYKNGATLASRAAIVTSDGSITPIQGNNMCVLNTFSGDTDQFGNSGYRTLAICRPPIGTPQSGNFTYQMDPGYDSAWHFAINVPPNYPTPGDSTNLFLCGLEMHHTGGAVAPFHMWFWNNHVEFQVAKGTTDTARVISVSANVLQNYIPNEWYGFALRYKHHPTNGHFEVWAGNMQRDSALTQVVNAPGVGTMYADASNYAQWGQYMGSGGPLKMRFDALGEVGTLTEAKNYMNALFAGGSPPLTPTISGFNPTTGATGTSVTITGTNFTGATNVKFGGVDT